MKSLALLLALAALLSSPARAENADGALQPDATATLKPAANSKVSGTVLFFKNEHGVRVVAHVKNLTPGKHGFHIHEKGDLSAPDLSSAGGHFNPTQKPHGGRDADNRHQGDFGNIEADASGTANTEFVDTHISVEGPNSIIGRSVIVHQKEDDLKSQPSGDAGGRIAGGVIEAAKKE